MGLTDKRLQEIRQSVREFIGGNFGKGGETYCPGDGNEIIYGELRPEHAPPMLYDDNGILRGRAASARSLRVGYYQKLGDGAWTEGGYCPECNFTTKRPLPEEKRAEIERRLYDERWF